MYKLSHSLDFESGEYSIIELFRNILYYFITVESLHLTDFYLKEIIIILR